MTTTDQPVAHIRRTKDGSNLCGEASDDFMVVAEGDDPGSPYPCASFCEACEDVHFGS